MGREKIFADAIRNRFLPDKKLRHFAGRENYDECWTGFAADTSRTQPLQITFLNAAWSRGYADKEMEGITITERAAHFEKSRQHGGISLVHNDRFYAAQKSWLNIWVETRAGDILDYPPRAHIKNTGAEVRYTFNKLAEKNHGRAISKSISTIRAFSPHRRCRRHWTGSHKAPPIYINYGTKERRPTPMPEKTRV